MSETLEHALATRSAFSSWRMPADRLQYAKLAWLYGSDSRRYLDFASGSGSLILGHADEGAVAALATQTASVAVFPGNQFRVPVVEGYVRSLAGFCGGRLSRVVLASSGSDAVDAACKLALQFHHSRGEGQRRHIIGRSASYHGNSLFGLSAGGFKRRRAPFESALWQLPKAAPAFCYRCQYELTPDTCGLRCAQSIDDIVRSLDPRTVAAVILEPVVGAALGAAAAPAGYLARVREICDEHGILLIFDEVMSGFARTGRAFAWQHEGTQPDILVMGKAMSGGYFPLSGIATTEAVAEPIRRTSPYFDNGQTHLFNAAGAAVGAYVLDRIRTDGLADRAARTGARLLDRLQRLREFDVVGDVRGAGLLLGIELVRHAPSKVPFDPRLEASQRFARFARDAGLIVYPSSGGPGTLAGDHTLLLPPLIIGDDEIEHAAACLHRAAGELQRWASDSAS